MIAIQCITAHFAKKMTWRFTVVGLAEECFPSGCCLQHANTDTSKMQVTIDEAKGAQAAQPLKKISCWEKYGQMEHKNWLKLHDCYRQTWVQLFWIQYLKTPIFFCRNMLEIWIQTIFEAKWSSRDPAVFQSFCCMSNVNIQILNLQESPVSGH